MSDPAQPIPQEEPAPEQAEEPIPPPVPPPPPPHQPEGPPPAQRSGVPVPPTEVDQDNPPEVPVAVLTEYNWQPDGTVGDPEERPPPVEPLVPESAIHRERGEGVVYPPVEPPVFPPGVYPDPQGPVRMNPFPRRD